MVKTTAKEPQLIETDKTKSNKTIKATISVKPVFMT